jgi:hypothetical protein
MLYTPDLIRLPNCGVPREAFESCEVFANKPRKLRVDRYRNPSLRRRTISDSMETKAIAVK